MTYFVVGLMSGTSLDGIDAALVKIEEGDQIPKVALIQFQSMDYPASIRTKLLQLCQPESANLEDISMMNVYLSEVFADVVHKVIEDANMTPEDILLISSHGQTIYHQPNSVMMEQKMITSTLQIGDISIIAERTGIPTIGDFRTRDMAVGGQGAPLVPYVDYTLFRNASKGRIFLNIGGIANITIIPAGSTSDDVWGYDTGPGNMLMDQFTSLLTNGEQSYDDEGNLAAKGVVHDNWLATLMKHPYYHSEAPKSTGREDFGHHYGELLWREAAKLEIPCLDRLTTITALTSHTIALEIRKVLERTRITEIIVSGGGCYNKTLLYNIDKLLPGVKVMASNEIGVDANAKEAIAFAYLGYQCYFRRTNNLPAVTGAKKSVVMGKIAW